LPVGETIEGIHIVKQSSGQRKFQAIGLAALVALIAACSQVSDKGAIPPDGPPQKKVTDHDETVSFNPKVDILFVVDDSGSMESHQSNLSANIKLFTQEIQKTTFLDYHIGVVTTSMDGSADCDQTGGWSERACGDGKLVRYKTHVPFIDKSTPNGLSILEQNLVVGTNGSGEEMMFDPIKAALSAPLVNSENTGFLRPDATLAIIIVTDAEDQSQNVQTPKDLFDFLLNLKAGRADKVLAYAALVPSSVAQPTCPRDTSSVTPRRTEEFLALAKGLEFNICDTDYGLKLAHIAADVVQKVGRVMYLSRPPVVDTISVTYGSQVIPNDREVGWTYDPVRNALIFGDKIVLSVQPPGTTLSVNFTAGTY
jgi:hypothetical protein